jgi:acetyl esterase/lipase
MPSFRSSLFKVIIHVVATVFINEYYPKKYLRFVYSNVLPLLSPEVPGVSYEALEVSGIPAEWLIPRDAGEDGVIIYFHGGSYVMGSISSHRALAAQIGVAASARVLIVDYRLAPENKFPAAVEDAVASYRWLLSQGYSPEKIVLAGDSSGGGQVVAALVSLRDSGDPMPAGAMLLSPWTDLEMTGESVRTVGWRDPMVKVGPTRKDAARYLGAADAKDPLASPIYADLKGLPPLYIQVGTVEVLLDDARRLAERAHADEVSVELDVWDGMFHVWQAFSPNIPESKEAIQELGKFARGRMLAEAE